MNSHTPTLLDENQIQAILTKKNSLVQRGRLQESHLRIYTESLEQEELLREQGWRDLMQVKDFRLHKDKRDITNKFFSFPLPVVRETADSLKELYRVFEARNASFTTDYPNARAKAAGQDLMKRLQVHSYIQREGKKVIKNRPNTFVVLDKDEEGKVYPVTVNNDRLLNVKFLGESTTELDYIVFLHHTGKTGDKKIEYIAFYDAYYYRVYKKEDGKYSLFVENPHTLGKCPARPFLSATRTENNKFDRYNPFQEVRALLADFTLFECYTLHGQYYLSFPILEAPKQACEDPNCEDGKIANNNVIDGERHVTYSKCPSCSSKSILLGSGSMLEVDVSVFKDENDVSGYLRFVSPPTENIEYQDGRQTERRLQIKEAVTGINDLMSDQAVNIEQVRAVMEKAKQPLSFIARQLDELDVWMVESAHSLELGIKVNRFANWGTEWYLLTEEQIQTLYQNAKDFGLPEAETRELYTLLIETKYKSNPDQVRGKIIELNINPAPFSSIEEAYQSLTRGTMSREDFIIKSNFNKYVLRFERENSTLSEFGRSALTEKTKSLQAIINTIYQTFQFYVSQENTTEPPSSGTGASDDPRLQEPQS